MYFLSKGFNFPSSINFLVIFCNSSQETSSVSSFLEEAIVFFVVAVFSLAATSLSPVVVLSVALYWFG
jgi:hypothetical protein